MELPEGALDLLILKVVSLGPIHGYAIKQCLKNVTLGTVQVLDGSLCPVMQSLEKRGLLVGKWKQSETGRKAKLFHLTQKERTQLENKTADWQRLISAFSLVLNLSKENGAQMSNKMARIGRKTAEWE